MVGEALEGSGERWWIYGNLDTYSYSGHSGRTTMNQALEMAEDFGHRPGIELHYIQKVPAGKCDGKLYFYGPGEASGKAGEDTWAVERTFIKA